MPNAQTRAAMKEARAMQKARLARFKTADELFTNLNSDIKKT